MEITFEKVGNKYVAEFEATADFNIHIERTEQGTLEVYQRGTAEGEYDFAWSAGIGARKIIDYDFGALVYPKYIKVVSASEVLSASVNFNEGGGSGSGSEESDDNRVKYFTYNKTEANRFNVIAEQFAIAFNADTTSGRGIVGVINYCDDSFVTTTYAVAVDIKIKLGDNSVGFKTFVELCSYYGISEDELSALEITEEQFYNLEA